MLAKPRVPWTAVFVSGLALLAASPLFPSPTPALSLDAILGKVLYLGLLVMMVVGYIAAEMHADTARRLEQKERDDLTDSRHSADMAATAELRAFYMRESAKMLATQETMLSLMARGVRPDNPQVQELAETVKQSAATIGSVTITPGTGELILTGYAPEIVIGPVKSSGAHRP